MLGVPCLHPAGCSRGTVCSRVCCFREQPKLDSKTEWHQRACLCRPVGSAVPLLHVTFCRPAISSPEQVGQRQGLMGHPPNCKRAAKWGLDINKGHLRREGEPTLSLPPPFSPRPLRSLASRARSASSHPCQSISVGPATGCASQPMETSR